MRRCTTRYLYREHSVKYDKVMNMGSEEGAPIIREESSERVQAQLEAFGSSLPPASSDQLFVFNHLSELQAISGMNNPRSDISLDVAQFLDRNKDAYLEFVRETDPQDLTAREDSIKRYKRKLKPAVDILRSRVAKQKNTTKLPGYLGVGLHGKAPTFSVEVDGDKYAAKVFLRGTNLPGSVESLVRAHGIPHAAQLAGHSIEDGVIVMDLLPGKPLATFSPESAPTYTEKQVIELIKTSSALIARGLVLDFNPTNCLYDPEQGFGVLDFHFNRQKRAFDTEAQQIMRIPDYLAARNYPPIDMNSPDSEQQRLVQAKQKALIRISTIASFVNLLQRVNPSMIDQWKKENVQMVQNGIPQIPLYSKDTQDPQLATYVAQLQHMGI